MPHSLRTLAEPTQGSGDGMGNLIYYRPPRTWVAGEPLTASAINDELSDPLLALALPWVRVDSNIIVAQGISSLVFKWAYTGVINLGTFQVFSAYGTVVSGSGSAGNEAYFYGGVNGMGQLRWQSMTNMATGWGEFYRPSLGYAQSLQMANWGSAQRFLLTRSSASLGVTYTLAVDDVLKFTTVFESGIQY